MILKTFLTLLGEHPDASLQMILPGKNAVPAHFHVTEVGRVQKDFIDCGGTVRSETTCVMQVWVANDVDHRLNTSKLSRIFESSLPLLQTTDMPIEVEYETETASRYVVSDANASASAIVLNLGAKHTECLAPDRCGVNALQTLSVLQPSGCGPTGCC